MFGGFAHAAPRATASLSDETTRVGEAVTLEIEVEGEEKAARPALRLDDFDVTPTGQSQQTFITPGRVRNSVSYSYEIVPKREGTLTIPAIEVKVGGVSASTQPLTLKVAPPLDPKAAAELAFGEVVIAKPVAWVGEWVPARVNFYLREDVASWNPRDVGELKNDACLSLGYKQQQPQAIERDGKRYQRWTWTTVLVPSKAGKITLGPVALKTLVQRTDDKSPNYDPRSIFRGRRVGPVKEMTVSAPPVDLDVKPLPVADRPKSFDGAIGKFTFDGTGSVNRVKLGEPVEMTLTVAGEGNFDRLSDPPLADAKGWQSYPGKKNFQSSDDSSLRGKMTFSIPVVPSEKKDRMPVFEFCYFDPDAGKYVALRNADAPLVVEGDPVQVVSVAPKIEPKKEPVDLLPNKTSLGDVRVAAFAPMGQPLQFAALIMAPIPIIAAFVFWWRRRMDPAHAWRVARHQEIVALRKRMQAATERAEMLDLAMRLMELDATQFGEGGAADLEKVFSSRRIDEATSAAMRELFASRSELVYAGGLGGRIGEAERDRVSAVVDAYFNAPRT